MLPVFSQQGFELVALVMRLHRNIVRPLRAMEGTMADIAASLDFTQRVTVTRNDEIGQSVRAFNSLLDTLQRRPGLPVLFLTARSDEVDKLLGLEMGADDYVKKPFSQRLLVERIRALQPGNH